MSIDNRFRATSPKLARTNGLHKTIYPGVPPKVEYSLTHFGETLIPVISALGKWGDENQARLRNVITQRSENLSV